jgi:hypothetical protein
MVYLSLKKTQLHAFKIGENRGGVYRAARTAQNQKVKEGE